MNLYSTLTRQKESLPSPQEQKTIKLYSCGPTVYDETHIGHMRKYTMDDILVRSLKYLGYDVAHVMNITDVGHLTGDDDSGDDKLEKGAQKQGKTVWQVAEYYTEKFFETMDALGVQRPNSLMKATDNVPAMIDLVKQLEAKGYTYETDQAIYFDVTTFKKYGQLSGQKLEDKKQAVRDDVFADPAKKHPADFALWFRRVGRFADHTMHWPSPWGDGFPGWHIECSAMSMKALGETIDIHTGGIDHIPVHHENEIAQSEAATGKQFVKWWVHHAFLKVNGEKMSKSKGNFYTLKDLQEKNIDPMAVRYLFLQTHYRKELNFTWEAVEAAQIVLKNLFDKASVFGEYSTFDYTVNREPSNKVAQLLQQFKKAITDDLNFPKALGFLHEALNNQQDDHDLLFTFSMVDPILGIGFKENGIKYHNAFYNNTELKKIATEIDKARAEKNFQKSDELRKQIEDQGYTVENTQAGTVVKKI